MGKLLVLSFLGLLVLTVATALLLAADVVWGLAVALLRTLTTGHAVAPRVLEHPWLSIWLLVVEVLLLLVVPLVLLLFLALGLRPSRRPNPPPAPRHDLHGAPIAVVLTALDDEEAIGSAVDEVRALPEVGSVIVAENQSRDRTAEVAKAHGAHVVSEAKRGYGYVCLAGLGEALRTTTAPILVLSEGDMTFFAEDLRKLVPYLEDCDMVIGTRTNKVLNRPGSQMDWFAAWGNLFLALLIRLRHWDPAFWGAVQLTDVGCTFRAIRRDALERILPELTVGGMYFSPHMILVALRHGLSVVEAPIRFRARVGVSKGAGHSRRRAISIGLEMLREITLN